MPICCDRLHLVACVHWFYGLDLFILLYIRCLYQYIYIYISWYILRFHMSYSWHWCLTETLLSCHVPHAPEVPSPPMPPMPMPSVTEPSVEVCPSAFFWLVELIWDNQTNQKTIEIPIGSIGSMVLGFISLHDWVILFVPMLAYIPAPLSITKPWVICVWFLNYIWW